MAAPTVANSSIGNSTTTSVTTSAVNTTTGNRFLVFSEPTSSPPTSVTDNKGNTYTQKTSYTWPLYSVDLIVYECVNGTGGSGHTATVVWPAGSGNNSAVFLEIAGSGGTDFTVTAADSSSPFTITSPTLSSSEELAILYGTSDGGSNPCTFSESTGFTILQAQQDGSAYNQYFVASKTLSSTAAITPSFTGVGSTAGAAILMGFTPVAPPAPVYGSLGQWDPCLRIEGWF